MQEIIGLSIIKDGANYRGLRLIGDRMIGYCFVPRGPEASVADSLIKHIISETEVKHISEVSGWLDAHKDGPYDSQEWNAVVTGK